MYSVVLATVLTAGGTSVPGWGCHGCYGGCYGGCTGPVVSGYNGYHHNMGHHGSCYGACYGSCYGGYAGPALNGYLYNVGYYGAYRPYVVPVAGVFGGCCGGYSACFGGVQGMFASYAITYPAPPTPIPPRPVREKIAPAAKEEVKARPTQATVVVQLPEAAKLIVDGYVADLTSETRTFVTPDLEPSRNYYYTITAELIRDGRSIKQSQKVIVCAGETSRVDFGELAAAASARR